MGTSATSRRMVVAFAAILALFGAALGVELVTLGRIADSEADVERLDHAKHAGHMVAAQVRDQYIHQAHTLIEFGSGHLGHYAKVAQSTREAIAHLDELAETSDEKALVHQIATLAAQNDHDFQTTVVPAVLRGDHDAVRALGEELEAVVDQVVILNEQLNRRFEARSATARASARRLSSQAVIATLACFALAIVLAGAVGLWLSRFILKRVATLRAGARRVERGDFAARIALPGRDEFSELAGAFNQMTASLERDQAALVRSQKLASIGQVAAGIAHELNNPLAVILGYAKILRKQATAGDPEELRIIEDEATQCQRIVQGLLDLARPQQLDVCPLDIGELAREAVSRLDESGALRGHGVKVLATSAVMVTGDAGKLRQVIANLVVNAAEATPPAGQIAVDVRCGDRDAVLTVSDDGPGIPEDVQAHMFDPFFTTKRDGTGLGLAIAHAIVDAHGGRITIDSAPGTGTHVALHLPPAVEPQERVS